MELNVGAKCTKARLPGGAGDQFDQVIVLVVVVVVSEERRREPETERAQLSDTQTRQTERKIVEEKKN